MARIVYEQREFTDRNSGITTQYDYIAIAGNGEDSATYEVQLKNLVQSEKMALKMIAALENKTIGSQNLEIKQGTKNSAEAENADNWLDNLKD